MMRRHHRVADEGLELFVGLDVRIWRNLPGDEQPERGLVGDIAEQARRPLSARSIITGRQQIVPDMRMRERIGGRSEIDPAAVGPQHHDARCEGVRRTRALNGGR